MDKPVTPEPDRFIPNHPTVHQQPFPSVAAEQERVPCGICEHWVRSGRSPFGQCIKAQRALGATFYRSDSDSCSLGSISRL